MSQIERPAPGGDPAHILSGRPAIERMSTAAAGQHFPASPSPVVETMVVAVISEEKVVEVDMEAAMPSIRGCLAICIKTAMQYLYALLSLLFPKMDDLV